MDYEIIQVNEQTWRIEDGHVRFFLLTGTEEALLIDSGMQIRNAKEIAQSLTALPLKLLNTHADIDHIGSNHEFEAAYMNPAECYNYYKNRPQEKHGKIFPVWDGDILGLGSRPLEIITIPGHTPGSIAVLDKKYRALISGDPIQDGQIFMFGTWREIHAYQHSLQKLKRYEGQFDTIYPSHGSFPVKPELIDELKEGVEKMLHGKIVPTEASFHGMSIPRYDVGAAAFLWDGAQEE